MVRIAATARSASATPTSAPNSVPNSNGVPTASYTINKANANLSSGVISNNKSFNYNSGTYTFNPINTATPTSLVNNHPGLFLNGYVGGVMVTATSATYTKPYIVTNVTGQPGNVGIYLPGDSSEMLGLLQCRQRQCAHERDDVLLLSVRRLGRRQRIGLRAEHGAGTMSNPSNFAARAAAVFNGANTPISTRDDISLSESGGHANQQMVTAGSVGANTASFLTSISSVPLTPCACESTQWGFWSVYNSQKDSSGTSAFEDQGNLLLWVAGVPTSLANLPATGTRTLHGPKLPILAEMGLWGLTDLAAGTFCWLVNFAAVMGPITINGGDGAIYAGTANWILDRHVHGMLGGNVGGRSAARGRRPGAAERTESGHGEMGGWLNLTGTR